MDAKQRLSIRRQQKKKLNISKPDVSSLINALPMIKTLPMSKKRLMISLTRFSERFFEAPEFEEPIEVSYGTERIRCRYKMRTPEIADLVWFQEFSDESPNIEGSQPDSLDRRVLYKDWYAQGKNRRCFLLLEETLADGSEPLPIGISIILPINEYGAGILRVDGQSAGSLRSNHIVADNSFRDIVIDTWLVREGYKDKCQQAFSLLLRHLQLFWNPAFEREYTFWIEPAHPFLTDVCDTALHPVSNSAVKDKRTYYLNYGSVMNEAKRAEKIPEMDRTDEESRAMLLLEWAKKISRMNTYPVDGAIV